MNLKIGIDDGYNLTKVVLPDGRMHVERSRARVGVSDVINMDQSAQNAVSEYYADGMHYCAGDVDGEDTISNEYPYSTLNRVIVTHALNRAGVKNGNIDLVTGLPVGSLFGKGGINEENKVRKITNLAQPVVCRATGEKIVIRRQDVIAEGLAAFFDYLVDIDDRGNPLEHLDRAKEYVGIIDIGGRTTDFVVIDSKKVNTEYSGSLDAGMLFIRRRAQELIQQTFKEFESTVSARVLDMAMESNKIQVFGTMRDVTKIMDQAKSEVVEKIRTDTRRRFGTGVELDRVIFIGGGAVSLQKEIGKWFTHQTMPANPLFANARGMQKYARLFLN